MKSFVFCLMSFLLAVAANAQGLQSRQGGLLNRSARPATASQTSQTSQTSESAAADAGGRSIEFNAAPVDMVFTVYQDLVGKTVLKDPQTPAATITLQPKKGQELTDEDKIEAIETVLEMNGIHMEPYGEKFVRAIPRQSARKEGIPLILDEDMLPNTEKVVSTMIRFKNLPDINEAQKALEGFKSDKGQLQVFERTRSILVTDTQMNINRMREIAKEIDQPNPPMGLKRYERTFKYATAANVEKALTACYEFSKAEEEERKGKSTGTSKPAAQQPANSRPLLSQGLLRRPGQQPTQQQPTALESLFISAAMSDRALVRGRPLFIYDEENVPNKLIIVTYPENMELFDWIIEQLDVPTIPESDVKVYRLKYAEAEDVSDMINDLIGNTSGSKNSSKTTNKAQPSTAGGKTSSSAANKPSNSRSGEAKAGELSKETTTVLADKRINGLVVMALTKDFPTIEQIIESMDIKLSQVLIETVIIEVGLGDDLATGIDWVNNVQTGKDPSVIGGGGGGLNSGTLSAITGEGKSYEEYLKDAQSLLGEMGGTYSSPSYSDKQKALEDLAKSLQTAARNNLSVKPVGTGINYFLTSEKLNISAVIAASKADSHSKYIASPIIMTLDNKEAEIKATEMRYLFKGYTYSGSTYNGSAVPDYEQKELGITIKTTPKINPNGTVMLTIEEEYSQEGNGQAITAANGTDKINAATTITRTLSADALLENGQTVVFGGLTETKRSEKTGGVPILKDIPIIGKWLFGYVEDNESRKELLVFMTPYVLDDAQAAQAEALRRKKAISDSSPWDDHGWSASALADPVSKKEQMRRIKDEARKQDEERKTKIAIEKWKVERAKKLQAMSAEERAQWLLLHKEDLDKEAQDELEEKMLDEKSQEELKKLAEAVRAKKQAEAEKVIKQAEAETAAENERAKLDAVKKAEDREGENTEK